MSHIKSPVILSLYAFMYLSGYKYLGDGVRVYMTADLSSGHKVSRFGGDIFKGHVDQKRKGVGFGAPFDCEYLENGKSER